MNPVNSPVANPCNEIPQRFFGIECRHHYGITTHPMPGPGQRPEDAVYRLIRDVWHPFNPDHETNVTDDNHTWNVSHFDTGWSCVEIIKNENSPEFALAPSWVLDGPGKTWFTQEFRIATDYTIAEEIADLEKSRDRWRKVAADQKDNVSGKRRRREHLMWADAADRRIDLVVRRWNYDPRIDQ